MTPPGDLPLPVRATAPYAGVAPHVSERVLASWRRSEDYGVSLDEVDPVWAGGSGEDSLFFECGQEVLTGLHQTLANEPISLMLTDARGLVLNRLSGDTSLLRALDKVHLAPGFAYSERDAGTNGVGLALADRVPTLVRAAEHYSASLCTYTCAAVPVLDPVTGRLEGAVNITTWSMSSTDLLLALAQSAAGNTSALMLARGQGRAVRPQPQGGVFRVQKAKLEPGAGSLREMSSTWTTALAEATQAIEQGEVVAAVGEPGSGRVTLLAQALRRARPRDRILSAASPEPRDVEAWLSMWTPELAKDHTAVIVSDVDVLAAWGAQALYDRVATVRAGMPPGADGVMPALPWAITAEHLASVPQPLLTLVDRVIEIAPLRDRPEDVMILARYVAQSTRVREVAFTPAAEQALTSHRWTGNVDELFRVVHAAALRTDVIDTKHLPPDLVRPTGGHLSRIESFERDEILRCLTRRDVTVADAAKTLGMSRATLYRKITQYRLEDLR
jgi:hypothetical protein